MNGVGSPAAFRLAVVLTLLISEYLVLGVLFDGSSIVDAPTWWSHLSNVGALVQIAAAIGTAALVLEGPATVERLARASVAVRPYDWRWGAAHFGVFVLFAGLTVRIFEGAPPAGFGSWALLAGWSIAGGLVVFTAMRWTLGPALGLILAGAGKALQLGLLLGVAAWFLARRSYGLWHAMADWTLQLSAACLRLFSHEVSVDSEQSTLGLAKFTAVIGPFCSGVEGLAMMAVFCGGYLCRFRARLRFPHALLLLPISLSAIWLANAVRIAALVAIGAWISPDIAFGAFHSKAGWLFFCALTLGTVVLSERSRFFSNEARALAPGTRSENPTAAYCMPMLALLGLGMLTSAFAGALDSLYPVRVVGALAALYWFRGDWLPRSSERGASWQALAIGGLVFVVWIGLSPAADTAHNAAFVRELDALDAWQRYIWLAVRVVGAVVVVPIAEELAFRGYLQRRMLAADFTAVPQERFGRLSLIATALTFGALHASWLAGTFAGLAYALAVYRRGRLADAIAAHATTNALLAAWVVGYQRWDLW